MKEKEEWEWNLEWSHVVWIWRCEDFGWWHYDTALNQTLTYWATKKTYGDLYQCSEITVLIIHLFSAFQVYQTNHPPNNELCHNTHNIQRNQTLLMSHRTHDSAGNTLMSIVVRSQKNLMLSMEKCTGQNSKSRTQAKSYSLHSLT